MSDVPFNPIRSVVIPQSVSGLPPSPGVIFHDKVRMLENAGAFGIAWNDRQRATQVSVGSGSSSPSVGSAGSAGYAGADTPAAPALSASVGVAGSGGHSILAQLPASVRLAIRWGLPVAAVVMLFKGHEIAAIATGAAALYVWKPAVVGLSGTAGKPAVFTGDPFQPFA